MAGTFAGTRRGTHGFLHLLKGDNFHFSNRFNFGTQWFRSVSSLKTRQLCSRGITHTRIKSIFAVIISYSDACKDTQKASLYTLKLNEKGTYHYPNFQISIEMHWTSLKPTRQKLPGSIISVDLSVWEAGAQDMFHGNRLHWSPSQLQNETACF